MKRVDAAMNKLCGYRAKPTYLINVLWRSRLSIFLSLLISALLVSCFVPAAEAAENPEQPGQENSTMNAALKPPTSPQEMWQRILMILNKDLGFVTKKEMQNLIGVSFSNTEKEGEKRFLGAAYLHSSRGGIPMLGEVEMVLFEDPKKSSFTITWGDPSEEMPGCLDYKRVSSDLRKMGFRERDGVYLGARPSNVQFTILKDAEEFNRLIANIKDRKEKDKLTWEFEMSRNEIFVVIPRDKSQCVTGISVTSPYRK